MISYAAATPRDLPEIRDLLSECGLPTEDLSAESLAHFLTARAQGSLVGCVGLEPLGGAMGLLRSLAVKPEHRGLGIASRLADDIEAHARAEGLCTLYLLTTTAGGYFTPRGYRHADRGTLPEAVRGTAQFRQLCPTTAVAMKKHLGEDGASER